MGKRKNADEQTGQPAVPEGGTAVPADAGVPAEKQPDPVSADPGAPAADGAGDLPAQDPAPAVDGDALAVGAETADAAEAEWRVDTAWLARECAGLARLYGHGNGPVDLTLECFTRDESAIMVDFVRANPAAPVLAMYKHLELTKRLRPAEPNDEDMLALSVFHAVAQAAIAYEARCSAREPQSAPPPAAAWPGERSFKVQEPAFSPTGFRPR